MISFSDKRSGIFFTENFTDLILKISSDRYKDECEQIRSLNQAGEFEKAAVEALQRQLPCFCGSTFEQDLFEFGSSGWTNRREKYLNKIYYAVIQIKNVSPFTSFNYKSSGQDVATIKKDIKYRRHFACRSCTAAFSSPTDDVLNLFFRLSKPMIDIVKFRRVWLYLAGQVEECFTFDIDKTGNSPVECFPVSHDPYLFYDKDRFVDLEEIELYLSTVNDFIEPTMIFNNPEVDEPIILDAIGQMVVRNYKNFRDLCSAASNFGEEFLAKFYDKLYNNSALMLSDETRIALKNKEVYIYSYLQDENKMPLQTILNTLEKYDVRIRPKSKDAKKPMFNMNNVMSKIVDYMNERYVSFLDGANVICLPEVSEKRYFDLSNNESTLASSLNKMRIVKRTDKKADLMNRRLKYYNEKGDLVFKEYFDIWWNSPKRRQCKVITCSPVSSNVAGTLSAWTGFNVNPDRLEQFMEKEKNIEKPICSEILDFFREIICNNDDDQFILLENWIADMLQNPTSNKPGIAIVLRSDGMGTGKGTFSTFMRDIVGPEHSIEINDVEDMTGPFNSIIEHKLFVSMDEAIYSGDRKSQKKLMNIITSDGMNLKEKFVKQYPTDNIARFCLMTNDHHVVHMTLDDRRFAIFEVNESKKHDKKYWSDLRKIMGNGGKESLFSHYMNFEIDRTVLDTRLHRTGSMKEQQKSSFDSFDKFIVEILSLQRIGNELLKYEIYTKVSEHQIYGAFKNFSKDDRYKMDKAQFFNKFIKLLGINKNTIDYLMDDEHNCFAAHYEIPPINELCAKLELHAPENWKPQKDSVSRTLKKDSNW